MSNQELLFGDNLLKEVVNGRQPFSPVVAQHIFKRYIALLYRLCIEEKNSYDVVIGPGDSGAVMVYFAELFFREVAKPCPQKLIVPVQRFIDPDDEASGSYDNNNLLSLVKEQLGDIISRKVLFVDDEIWKAHSASASASLVVNALPPSVREDRILFTIIAENHGFEWHYDIPPIAIQYYAFSKKLPGINNAILRFSSQEQQQMINEHIGPYLNAADTDGQTRKMDILFNNQVKVQSRLDNEVPYFKQVAVSTPEVQTLRTDLQNELINLIHQAMEEYQDGRIIFAF